MKLLRTILELSSWLIIAAVPGVLAGLFGLIIYSKFPGDITLFLMSAMGLGGFIFGIIKATQIRNKTGTLNFLSRLMGFKNTEN